MTAFKPVIGQKHLIEAITLLPSGSGRYEVTVDGELIYSKAATGQHTTNDFIIACIKEKRR